MTRAPEEDDTKPVDKGLADTTIEEDFFAGKRPSRLPPGPVAPAPVEPRIRPKRVDPTPSEVFFGESLAEMLNADQEPSPEEPPEEPEE